MWSGHAGYMRQSYGPGWALVGDAGYFKDPISAHGLTDALRDAELLARAVIAGRARTALSLDWRSPPIRRRGTVSAIDAVRHRRPHRQPTSGTTPRSRSSCSDSARRWPTRSRLLSSLSTGGRCHEPPHAARRVGPPRRRGLPVGRPHGRAPPARRPGRRRHRHARRARHDDPATWPPGRLAAHRHRELRRSLADARRRRAATCSASRTATAPATTAPTAIARYIADLEPDLIVTFGPDGMTGHPDHRAVSRWTTDAWAPRAPTRDLWYATVTTDFHQRWGPVNEHVGLWADQPEPPCTQHAELCHSITLAERPARRQGRRAPSARLAIRTARQPDRSPRLSQLVVDRVVPLRRNDRPVAPSPHALGGRHTMTAAHIIPPVGTIAPSSLANSARF